MNVLENIKKIRIENHINQELIAEALGCDVGNYSKIENGIQKLTVDRLEIIANVLRVRVIDLFTYPQKFVDKTTIENAEKISVTFEVSPDKRDILLNLVTGETKKTELNAAKN